MKAMEGEQTLMRIFLGERDRVHGRPLVDMLVELFRAEGLAGATVVLEVIDSEEKIRGILPRLEELMGGGLITFERVQVIRYRGHDR